jgi:hypothetical protein
MGPKNLSPTENQAYHCRLDGRTYSALAGSPFLAPTVLTSEQGPEANRRISGPAVNALIELLPRNLRGKELREEIIVVGLQLRQIWLGMSLGVQVIDIEFVDPLQHLYIVVAHQVPVGAVPVRRIERVIAQHVQRFLGHVIFHDLTDVSIVAKGHVQLAKPAVWLVDAVFGLV